MATDIRIKYNTIRDFVFNEDPDNMERVGDITWPLIIVIVYVLFVKVIGPQIMQHFKPFKMNFVLIAFNVFIVSWNAYVSYNLMYLIIESLMNGTMCGLTRNPANNAEYTMRGFKYTWLFYMSKYVDLLDTIFFVMRKKFRQISFLHVFHHAIVILLMWYGFKTKTRGGYIAVVMSLNAFVHVCTYSYYALAACGPKMQAFLNPRKIYLTAIQVGQFVILLAYLLFGFISGCEELDRNAVTLATFLTALMFLFANFYMKNYKTKKE